MKEVEDAAHAAVTTPAPKVISLTAVYEMRTGDTSPQYYLDICPSTIKLCKRQHGSTLLLVAENTTYGNASIYRDLKLKYEVKKGGIPVSYDTAILRGPDSTAEEFVLCDSARTEHATIVLQPQLNVNADCSFQDPNSADAYVIEFSHFPWRDGRGSGNHNDIHIEC
jgi:hypothetical protein